MDNKLQKIIAVLRPMLFITCLVWFLFVVKASVVAYNRCYCPCGCTTSGDCKTCTPTSVPYCKSSLSCVCGCVKTSNGGFCIKCCSNCTYGCYNPSTSGGSNCKSKPIDPYCNPTLCPSGCSSITTAGGVCFPYCRSECSYGCKLLSDKGGECADSNNCTTDEECKSYCNGHAKNICSYACINRTCMVTMNEPVDECSNYPVNWTLQRGCGGECVNCKLYKYESCLLSLRITACGTCGGAACGLCNGTAPSAPTAISPSNIDTQIQTTMLTWAKPASWGTVCGTGGRRGYQVCVESTLNTGATCKGKVFSVDGENTLSYDYTSQYEGLNFWRVRAFNKDGLFSAWSALNYCFIGLATDVGYPFNVSAWSACSAVTHTRSRTCLTGCQCVELPLVEECGGVVSGTLFNATGLSVCPGDLTDIEKIGGVGFGLVDGDSYPAPSVTGVTNSLGNYATEVLAPGNYSFDFSGLSGYDTTPTSVLACNGTTAIVVGSDPTCLIQPCTYVQNMNFGLLENYGGWWQVKGGSIYGEGGVQSSIPSSFGGLALSNQRLILPDGTTGRNGFLAYGEKIDGQLGGNPNAVVSEDGWEILSGYEGLRYDYNFYKTRMDIFAQKPWAENSIDTYDDGGTGYQVFVSENGVSLDVETVVDGGKKVVILVDGNVSINQNIEVESGSFLSIIASGTITFNTGVTQAEGWFVAETINVPCHDGDSNGSCDEDDSQFLGEGSFVGWTSINLTRDQGDLNNTQSAELFTYRPDFLINVPAPMKVYTRRFSPFIP